jgi:hypothetical protein
MEYIDQRLFFQTLLVSSQHHVFGFFSHRMCRGVDPSLSQADSNNIK